MDNQEEYPCHALHWQTDGGYSGTIDHLFSDHDKKAASKILQVVENTIGEDELNFTWIPLGTDSFKLEPKQTL
jgi:hypothetical protein